MPRAAWTLTLGKRSVNSAGTVQIQATLLDKGAKQADLIISVTPERVLTVTWANEPGTDGLSFFQAWEK